jgi:PKD repeat protein
MKTRYILFSAILLAATASYGQLTISATGVPVTENFTTFDGSGFSASPTVGQLNSNTWRITGLSEGDLAFGAEGTSGDYARGASAGSTSTGGIFAFNSGVTNGAMLGVQPTGGDYSPGSMIVKITNNSASAITALQINYDIIVLNDQARSSSVNMSYSLNDADFTAISALGYNTPEAADAAGWTVVNKSFLLTGLNVGIGSSIYLSWDSDDVSGSGSRDEFGIDNISITAVETGANPIVSFAKATMLVSEGQTTFDIKVLIDGKYNSQTTVEVALVGGNATNSSDFVFVSPTTVIFPANDSTSKSITVVVTDDNEEESVETIEFELQSATNNGTIANGNLEVSIQDNDKFIPNYTIDQINDVDGNGLIDSAGVYCRIHAYVYGVNFRSGGLQFFVNDLTGGLQVFDGANNLGYNVSSGDSVRIIGTIGQFNGQLQMAPDSIVLLSQNNGLPAPQVVTSLDESLEGELVQINCVSLDDVQAWDTGNGSGFTVTINSGQASFDVRVDDQSELFNATAPDFTFNLVGVVGQFDGDDPRDEGYQIYPWSNFQVQNTLKADFSFDITAKTVDFTSTSIGAIIHTWSFDDQTTSSQINPTSIYAADGSYDVLLTVQNTDACVASVTKTVVINTTAIQEQQQIHWAMYPTVVEDVLNITVNNNNVTMKIYTMDGKEVLSKTLVAGNDKIDVAHFGSGLYFTKIWVEDRCETRKWIKK